MTQALDFKFGITGEDDVQRAIQNLGKTGEEAFRQIQRAAERLGGQSLARFVADVRTHAREVSRSMVTARRRFDDFGTSIGFTARRVTVLTAALAATTTALVAFVRSSARAADEIAKGAERTGQTVQQFQRLQFVAEQSGVGLNTFERAMARLNTLIGDADPAAKKAAGSIGEMTSASQRMTDLLTERGAGAATARLFGQIAEQTEQAGDALSKLGIRIRDANGALRSQDDILADIADAFGQYEEGPLRAAAVTRLFGERVARELLPIINLGGARLRALQNDFRRLGLGISGAEAAIGTRLVDTFTVLGRVIGDTRTRLGLLFAPALTRAAQTFTDAIAANRDQLLALGADIATRVAPIIDNLVNVFLGRDAEVVNRTFLEWRDAIVGFAGDVQRAITGVVVPAFRVLIGAANTVARVLNSVFGAQFSGAQLLVGAAVLRLLGVFRLFTTAVRAAGAAVNVLAVALTGRTLLGAIGLLRRRLAPLIITLTTIAFLFRDQIREAMQGMAKELDTAFGTVERSAANATSGFKRVLAPGLQDVAREAKRGAEQVGEAIEEGVKADFTEAKFHYEKFGRDLFDAISRLGQRILDPLLELDAAIKNIFREMFGIGTAQAAEELASPFQAAAQEIEGIWQRLVDLLAETLRNAIADLRNAWSGFASFVRSTVDGMVADLGRLISRIEAAIEAMRRLNAERARGGGSGDAPGFARGGSVRGPGTGTSDSILARLSKGEYVIRAKAVRHVGLGLLNAINNLRLPKDLLKRLRGFSLGGLVSQRLRDGLPAFANGGLAAAVEHRFAPLAVPALATGGLSNMPERRVSSHEVTFNIGGERVGPFIADEQVMGALHRAATREIITSAGRRQSSVK